MASKGLLVLGTLVTAFLFLSSHVAAGRGIPTDIDAVDANKQVAAETSGDTVGESKIQCRYGCAVSINWICKVCKPKPPEAEAAAAVAAVDGDGEVDDKKAAGAGAVGGDKRQLCNCCEYRGRHCWALCCPNGAVFRLDGEAVLGKPKN